MIQRVTQLAEKVVTRIPVSRRGFWTLAAKGGLAFAGVVASLLMIGGGPHAPVGCCACPCTSPGVCKCWGLMTQVQCANFANPIGGQMNCTFSAGQCLCAPLPCICNNPC
jgi:hypothetical protein